MTQTVRYQTRWKETFSATSIIQERNLEMKIKKERKSMFPGSYDIEYALRVHSEMETQVRLLVV